MGLHMVASCTLKSCVMVTVNSRGQQSIMVAVVRLHRRKRKNVTYRVNWEVVSILFTPVSLLNFLICRIFQEYKS